MDNKNLKNKDSINQVNRTLTDKKAKISWNPKIKITVIGVVAFIVLFYFIGSNSNSNQNQQTNNVGVVKQTKPTVSVHKKKKTNNSPVSSDPCSNMVGTSMWATCEDANQPPEPKLNATVQTSDQYLIVTNNSNTNWTDCYVSIDSDISPNDFYQQDPSSSSSIPAGGAFDFSWGNIVKLDGARFNFASTQPNDIIVGCDQGIWTNYQ